MKQKAEKIQLRYCLQCAPLARKFPMTAVLNQAINSIQV